MRRLVPEIMFIALILVGCLILFAADNPPLADRAASKPTVPESLTDSERFAIGKWTDNRCGTCHEIDPLFSHPVGIVPSMQAPADLPLENGRITCATCHDNDDAATHRQARFNGDSLLRNEAKPAQLCARCHSTGSNDPVDLHALNATDYQAHLIATKTPLGGPSPGLTPERQPDFENVDAESQQCMTCHDGTVASGDLNTRHGSLRRGRRSRSHPIGVEYPADATARYMVPEQALNDRIRLFGGMVGCGSCHSPYSRIEGHLVLPNSGSNLCLSCHAE